MTGTFESAAAARRSARSVVRAVLALLTHALLLIWQGPALAHALDQSYVFIELRESHITGSFQFTVADLNRALGTDFPAAGAARAEDVAARADRLQAYVREKVRFAPNGRPVPIEFTGQELLNVSFGQFAVLRFRIGPLTEPLRFIDIDYGILFDELPDHRGLLVIAEDWKSGTFNNERQVAMTFAPAERQQRLDLSSSTVWSGFVGLLELGIHHIWVGIDHVLFLLALLLPAVLVRGPAGWEPVSGARAALWNVTKVVTMLTLAHSLTLAGAALGWVHLPSRLVESVIALSIAIAAADLVWPIFGRRILWVVFAFGLFHGFGFASVLGAMQIPSQYLALTLFGFNLGVELGQLAIVCAAFPLLYLIRSSLLYRRYLLVVGAAGLISISMYWFTERAFDIDLPAGEYLNRLIAVSR